MIAFWEGRGGGSKTKNGRRRCADTGKQLDGACAARIKLLCAQWVVRVTRMRTGAGSGLAGGPVTMEDMLKTVSVGCSYAVRAPRGVAGLDVAQHPWVVANVESFVAGRGVPLSVKVAEALSLEPDSAAFKRIDNVTAKAALWPSTRSPG